MKEENVFTECFQRDSTKDQAVVFVFIGATAGLLGWAGIRPWVEGWRQVRFSVIDTSSMANTVSALVSDAVIFQWRVKAIVEKKKLYDTDVDIAVSAMSLLMIETSYTELRYPPYLEDHSIYAAKLRDAYT